MQCKNCRADRTDPSKYCHVCCPHKKCNLPQQAGAGQQKQPKPAKQPKQQQRPVQNNYGGQKQGNPIAVVGCIFSFLLPLVLLGFLFSIIGLAISKRRGGAGKIPGIIGLIVSILVILFWIGVAVFITVGIIIGIEFLTDWLYEIGITWGN